MKGSAESLLAVKPSDVRYIKLGRGGMWERECEDKGIIRLGFGSSGQERFRLCKARRWDDLTKSFIAEGKTSGTATRFTNETRLFFEDDGRTLWVTFIGDRLCWGFLSKVDAEPHEDGHGVFRQVNGGWHCTDLNGEPLTKGRLSSALTQIAAYQGTSCSVREAAYLLRRIKGETIPEVEVALRALKEMKVCALSLMQRLRDTDFEVLIDLIFTTSGWRRQGEVGGRQKTKDIDLMLPSTGERAFVQVKSKTNQKDLMEYQSRLDDFGPYDRMFFVYHSGNAHSDDERVTVIGPQKLADLVVDAGLVNWLIDKVA